MNSKPRTFPVFIALLLASLFSFGLWYGRVLYSGYNMYGFLIWNLILAWIPFGLALIVIKFPVKHYVTLIFGTLWLLFLPNAPYILTDFLHLRPRGIVPLWYDMLLIFSFALTGLCLGFVSLALMQMQVAKQWGHGRSWLFVFTVFLLCGFGIYIGRFLRWNSWDIFSSPLSLWQDLYFTLTTPRLLAKMLLITSGFGALLTSIYLVFTIAPQSLQSMDTVS